MNAKTTPPVKRPHTPLAVAVRRVTRAVGVAGRRPVKPITFDSAL